MKGSTKKLVLTALFTALIYIGTRYIQIPLPLGYFNVGDCFILVLAWSVGGIYGMLGAGLAAGLADVLSGFSVYAPATVVIKALMALVAYLNRAQEEQAQEDDRLCGERRNRGTHHGGRVLCV